MTNTINNSLNICFKFLIFMIFGWISRFTLTALDVHRKYLSVLVFIFVVFTDKIVDLLENIKKFTVADKM